MAQVPITDASFQRTYDGKVVPMHIRDGLARFINEGCPTGSFLEAVLSNDLRDAIGRADAENRANLHAIVAWLHCEAPSACWGSAGKVQAWIDDMEKLRENPDADDVGGQARAVFRGVLAAAREVGDAQP